MQSAYLIQESSTNPRGGTTVSVEAHCPPRLIVLQYVKIHEVFVTFEKGNVQVLSPFLVFIVGSFKPHTVQGVRAIAAAMRNGFIKAASPRIPGRRFEDDSFTQFEQETSRLAREVFWPATAPAVLPPSEREKSSWNRKTKKTTAKICLLF